ncbi:Iq Domain-Containing Protein M [Manis pentadactyla]|nr:Iq Domain-Containing Protein M [Manis pentadactyla]
MRSGGKEESKERVNFRIQSRTLAPYLVTYKILEQVKLGKIVTNIESVSKKMEKEKQKPRMLDSSYAFPVINLGLRPMTSSSMGLPKENETVFYDWRGIISTRASHFAHDSILSNFSGSSVFRDSCTALYHGPNLGAVIKMYHRLMHRVKYRLGLWRTRQIVNFAELEEWMDRKKFVTPIKDTVKYSEIIKKSNAIEMLFTLYPPQGAHVHSNVQVRSTWLRPIVNGEEGYKYIVNGHPILKRANIQIVGKLVSRSMRDRKMRQHYYHEK